MINSRNLIYTNILDLTRLRMLGAGLVRKPPTLNESINVETTEKMGEKYYG